MKCIVDNNRRQILHSLSGGELSVGDIVSMTGLEQTLVSFHLRSLRKCGLVKTRRVGKQVFYSISNQEIIDVLENIRRVASNVERECGVGCGCDVK